MTPGGATHPMGERERLALFNRLGALTTLDGKRVLDAFSGSGALGIEALSRGADEVVFIEHGREAAHTIRENLAALELTGVSTVVCGKIPTALAGLSEFDVVLADPPYDKFTPEMVAPLTSAVKDGGILVVSHPAEPPELMGMQLAKTGKYAKASVSFYAKM